MDTPAKTQIETSSSIKNLMKSRNLLTLIIIILVIASSALVYVESSKNNNTKEPSSKNINTATLNPTTSITISPTSTPTSISLPNSTTIPTQITYNSKVIYLANISDGGLVKASIKVPSNIEMEHPDRGVYVFKNSEEIKVMEIDYSRANDYPDAKEEDRLQSFKFPMVNINATGSLKNIYRYENKTGIWRYISPVPVKMCDENKMKSPCGWLLITQEEGDTDITPIVATCFSSEENTLKICDDIIKSLVKIGVTNGEEN